ncbi:MAG: Flp pilus assembly protein TadB [Flavobacteriales bacterium]|jgi:Flp pilus assembly protein TadB
MWVNRWFFRYSLFLKASSEKYPVESSSKSTNQSNSHSQDGNHVRKKVRKKIRKKRDVLDEKVRKYRRKREHATINRQKVERVMLVIAGLIVAVFLVNIILVITSEVNLNWLTWIIVSIGMLGFTLWSILRILETLVIKTYQRHRQEQRTRDNDL